MTTHPTAAAATGLPKPEFSLYGLSTHLDTTFCLMAALSMAISTIEHVQQRFALTALSNEIEERISIAQDVARQHYELQQAQP